MFHIPRASPFCQESPWPRTLPCRVPGMQCTQHWQHYFDTMSKVLAKSIDVSPHVAIFSLPVNYTQYSVLQLEVIAFTFTFLKLPKTPFAFVLEFAPTPVHYTLF